MQSVKRIIHEIADQLSEDAIPDDAMHALYVRRKLARAIEAAERGRSDLPGRDGEEASGRCALSGRTPRAMISRNWCVIWGGTDQ